MFKKLLKQDKTMSANAVKVEKRQATRRSCDQCISEIDGQNYPVEDWSMGGARIFGDFRTYKTGDVLPITMKFKLRDQILKLAHTAQIVRKGTDTVGVQFSPLSQIMKGRLQQVIDDFNAREFANSQT